ncbi:MAG: DUF3330 domain-containing protein [Gammaproteobacteria bacterium]|nr:DUF3330 domain-containing protein [Gammaproteobacteria bacterium]
MTDEPRIDEPRVFSDEASVSCRVCRREVPRSEAKSVEGKDYVWYFCGLGCYSRWRRRAAREGEDRDGGS